MPEPFTISAGTGAAAAPYGVSGGRRRSGRKLRMVKKATVRRMLKSKGLKMRGGGEDVKEGDDAMGGRRRRKTGRKTRRRSLFGMKY
jgi:hypothetical protein